MTLRKQLQHVIDAIRWLNRLIIPMMFMFPLLTIIAYLFNLDFINNGIELYQNVKDALDAGMAVSAEQLTTASNVLLLTGILSYVPILVMMSKRNKEPGGYRKVEVDQLFKWLCLGMILNLCVQFGASLAATIPGLSQSAQDLELSNYKLTSGNPLLAIFSVGILGPMVEEVALRRGVQKNLCKINPTFCVVVASVLFGILHGNLIQDVAAIIMGLGLGYMYYKTDNLWYPTALHMVVNLNSVLNSMLGLNGVFTTILLPIVFGILSLMTKKKTSSELMVNSDLKDVTDNKQPIKVKVRVKKIKTNTKDKT